MNLKATRSLPLLCMALVSLTIACEEDSESEKEQRLLEEFLLTNNITVERTL